TGTEWRISLASIRHTCLGLLRPGAFGSRINTGFSHLFEGLNVCRVREEGVEPPRPFGHKILSLARLPVPPLPQVDRGSLIQAMCPTWRCGGDGEGAVNQSTLDCRRNAAHNRGKGAKRWLCAALKCGAQSENSSREPRTRAAQ